MKASAADAHLPDFALPHVLDCMPVGIAVFDRDGARSRANAVFDRLAQGTLDRLDEMRPPLWTGYDRDGTRLDPADYPACRALAGKLATPGCDFLYDPRGNEPRWLAVSAVPLSGAHGAASAGIVLVLEDVTERRRVDARLQETEDRFRQFAQHSHCALWVADATTGEFSFLNPACYRLWPHIGDDATLEAWLHRVHPEDRDLVRDARAEVAAGHGQTLSYRMVDTDGSVVRHLRETSFPLPGRGGAGRGVAGIVENVAPDVPLYVVGAARDDHDALVAPLERAGYRVKAFPDAAGLLAILDVLSPGCVLLRVADAGGDVPALVRSMRARCNLPIVLVGAADLSADAVTAAQAAGAIAIVPGLFEGDAMETALALARVALPRAGEPQAGLVEEEASPLALLSPRERQVLHGLIEGGTNKSIARTLGLSPRTVEVHRARLMDRLKVRTLPELVRIGLAAEL